MMICCRVNMDLKNFRIKKYDVGDSFNKHVDVADYKSARRWIAFLVYLNDNFSGGETEFYPHQQVIHPKTGRVLVFLVYGLILMQAYQLKMVQSIF